MASSLSTMDHEIIWNDPDIFVIRVPFTHLGLDHTNCYIVRDESDVLIIDPGAGSLLSAQIFSRTANAIGIDPNRARFCCTHLHFDHAEMLEQLSYPGLRLLISSVAYESNPWHYYNLRKSLLRAILLEEGVPAIARKGLAAYTAEARVCELPGCSYELLEDNQIVHVGSHALRVIATPGHSRGHICLYSDEQHFLFSGDHVLETITPGLSLPFEGDDSLRDYLDSLAKVEKLECSAVLPGHEKTFYDLAGRCANLRQHHAERLDQVFGIVAHNPGIGGHAVMQAMPWKRTGPLRNWDSMPLFSIMNWDAQTFSYLEYLLNIGEIELEEDQSGRHSRIAS